MSFQIPNKLAFLSDFLTALSRFSSSVRLKITPKNISAIAISDTSGAAMVAVYDTGTANEMLLKDEVICIRDIMRFAFLLEQTLEDSPTLKLDDGYILYSNKKAKFKMQLMSDAMLPMSPIGTEYISGMSFTYAIPLDEAAVNSIFEYSCMSKELKKIYFYHEDDGIHFAITDKTQELSDMASRMLIENAPNIPEFSIDYDFLAKKMDVKRKGFTINYRDSGEVRIDVISGNTKLQYLVSANEG